MRFFLKNKTKHELAFTASCHMPSYLWTQICHFAIEHQTPRTLYKYQIV